MGASWLGLVRDRPMTEDGADMLVADLADLYGCGDMDARPAWRELAAIVATGRTLLLGYTENFAG